MATILIMSTYSTVGFPLLISNQLSYIVGKSQGKSLLHKLFTLSIRSYASSFGPYHFLVGHIKNISPTLAQIFTQDCTHSHLGTLKSERV